MKTVYAIMGFVLMGATLPMNAQKTINPDTVGLDEIRTTWLAWERQAPQDVISERIVNRTGKQQFVYFNDGDPSLPTLYLQPTQPTKLQAAGPHGLPLSLWTLTPDKNNAKTPVALCWAGVQPQFASGVDTTGLRRALTGQYGTTATGDVPAKWFSGRLAVTARQHPYCGFRLTDMALVLDLKAGEVSATARVMKVIGKYSVNQFGSVDMPQFNAAINTQLKAMKADVACHEAISLAIIAVTGKDGHLRLVPLQLEDMTEETTRILNTLSAAAGQLPAFPLTTLVTADGRVFNARLLKAHYNSKTTAWRFTELRRKAAFLSLASL